MMGNIGSTFGAMIMLGFGAAGSNEPIYAGTLVFGVIGTVLAYLAFFHDEMEAGFLFKAGSVMFLVLAIASTFWPMRPWPY